MNELSRPAEVTLCQEPKIRFPGHVLNISGKGIRLLLERPLPLGAAIGVKWERTCVLGEVRYCNRVADGNRFAVGLELEHALTHTIEMACLAQKLLAIEHRQAAR